ncbi:MAG: hypothetical protein A3I61_07070 [Acidobacteria bacterium RIFCSPLOWO2_02_FULL_68_18]|nr:MAG: hypothetical protein A3I61_07070 [Acidobacteria bacterium RIFCSPLOWO2_02_FULL_68_18]OFW49213.1 MAG: hypothetical protein A3G77_03860 [Acidobacteria bacterium RIFCSPLOWO2_12_FULL_68_19]
MTHFLGRCAAGTLLVLVSGAAAFAQPAPRMAAGCPLADPVTFHACAVEKVKTFTPPKTADGVPDMQGYWERAYMSQDIEEHEADAMNTQKGPSIVVDTLDRKVPYQPWAAEFKKTIVARYISPLAACLSPGVPRFVIAPGTHEIIQSPGYVFDLIEFAHSYRVVPTTSKPYVGGGIRLYNGDSRGRWEGHTLVVDVRNSNGLTWIDNAGNFYSDTLHVVERYTMMGADAIHYQASIEDPKVYTRPWTMVSALLRNKQPGFELFEQACHEGNRSIEGGESAGLKPYRGAVPAGR